ncbi:hypothetical protein LZ578_09170 [Jeotgalibaca sp. MA1X17-3]|uniref:competence protein CoiA n=1 Tax=Jeotgalibaca sp. MA1X17-3 TaxID=2908211 RepID=UPI001F300370|nr:competence protein CoiA family protein [Jeotgalibaca sp. MA1X17-3]UJF15158.1 hypothetical protein LZ578_09170 [Jeotgalibaca sp. MA1X17-3]
MLYAELQNGKRINAIEYSVELENSKGIQVDSTFFCPGCKERIFLKNGKQKLAHFSHYRESDCHSFSEGETHAHLTGKIKLWEWCKSQGLSVEMEAWLPTLQQRPDLLVTLTESKKIAIEYQCSPISLKKLKERTEGYRSIGYEVLWICGVDYIPSTRLKDKQTNFFIWSENFGCCLTCLDSHKGLLLRYRDFTFNQWDQLEYLVEKEPLEKLNFIEFWEECTGERIKKEQFLTTRKSQTRKMMKPSEKIFLLYRKDESHRAFLERVYLNRQTVQGLPDLLFTYPIKSVYWQTPGYIWKYAFLFMLQDLEQDGIVNTEMIFYFLSRVKKIRSSKYDRWVLF